MGVTGISKERWDEIVERAYEKMPAEIKQNEYEEVETIYTEDTIMILELLQEIRRLVKGQTATRFHRAGEIDEQ